MTKTNNLRYKHIKYIVYKTQSARSGNGPVFSIEWFLCNGRMIVLPEDDELDESVISPLPTKWKWNNN